MAQHDAARPAEPEADEDIRWMRRALAEAGQAFAAGDWPTGAVLVRDGRAVAAGRNRQESLGDPTAHAETDALQAAFRAGGPGAARGATLYCTMEPCPMCAGALLLAGVGTLVMGLRHATLRRTDLGRYRLEDFLAMTDGRLVLRQGALEADCLALRLRWGRDRVAPGG